MPRTQQRLNEQSARQLARNSVVIAIDRLTGRYQLRERYNGRTLSTHDSYGAAKQAAFKIQRPGLVYYWMDQRGVLKELDPERPYCPTCGRVYSRKRPVG